MSDVKDRETTKCVFCGTPRKKGKWMSKITIRNIETSHSIFQATVCPKCRTKHTIAELYKAARNELLKAATENRAEGGLRKC